MNHTVPTASLVDGQLDEEPSPPEMRWRRSVGGLFLPRPHPICSCRQPPVSDLPPPLSGGDLRDANRVVLGILAEKLLLSASNNKKSGSFPVMIHLLLQQALLVSFGYSDLLNLLELGVRQPRLIYKYSHKLACPLCAIPKLLFCKYFSRSSLSSSRDYIPMEAPTVHLASLCSRVLPKLLGLSPNLLKNKALLIETTLGKPPELPEDILMCILATLEIPDLVRAGFVCTSWRSAYITLRNTGKHKVSQTPCLLYTSESVGENVACLYSLGEKRVYKLNLPEPPIRSRFLIGSSLGLLVTVDEKAEMHLVNPITGEQIALPSVITFGQVNPVHDDSGAVHNYEYSRHIGKRVSCSPQIITPARLRDYFHYKALVFSDTSRGSYIVVLIHGPRNQLSFARVGDDSWTSLPPHMGYKDCTYKDGLLYAVTIMAEIHAYDLSGPAITMNIIRGMEEDLDIEGIYILQAPWGGLLLVWRSRHYDDHDVHADPDTLVMNTTAIKVHSVDADSGMLVEINCLDDHALFLGHNEPQCLSTKEYPALKGNHAYLTDDYECIAGRRNNRRDIGVLDLDNNSKQDLMFPQLWSNWPAPVWITPNLTMMKPGLNK